MMPSPDGEIHFVFELFSLKHFKIAFQNVRRHDTASQIVTVSMIIVTDMFKTFDRAVAKQSVFGQR